MLTTSEIEKLLDKAELRQTKQRTQLAKMLFQAENRHFTAEQLHKEARTAGGTISLATIYNTLHQFRTAGLLRQVIVEPGKVYFDTNTEPHHHFYIEDDGELLDVERSEIEISTLPEIPKDCAIQETDVIIRLRKK
ncbi:MAG: iron response transcriptional regulator IrrA [Thalassobaculaceae bacterium]|tara:strand:- start:227 stop:634 length:408 start_codon:yes stop_codon:yes gene_type:complete